MIMKNSIFISHSSRDTDFVIELRRAMEAKGLYNFIDSRELRGSNELAQKIHTAIEEAKAFIVIISADAFNSAWVAEETRYASQIKEKIQGNYPIIPLLREGIELGALKWIFTKKPVAIRVKDGADGIRSALPHILAALGKGIFDEPESTVPVIKTEPAEELWLELKYPFIEEKKGERRASATAELIYIPSGKKPCVESLEPFLFTAPLGTAEIDELRWYLEQYYLWPTGTLKTRAQKVENKLPEWGYELWNSMQNDICRNVFEAWRDINDPVECRFTVFVDSQLIKGSSRKRQKEANEASALMLALPWELLRDRKGYLFQGAKSVMTQRQLPLRKPRDLAAADPPIRILLVSPRPEYEKNEYIEHRISQFPLVESLEAVGGESAEITLLTPATFPSLKKEIEKASNLQMPFHVIHIDGHGIYKRDVGLGGICFEDIIKNERESEECASLSVIHSGGLADIMRDYQVHLFFSRSLSIHY